MQEIIPAIVARSRLPSRFGGKGYAGTGSGPERSGDPELPLQNAMGVGTGRDDRPSHRRALGALIGKPEWLEFFAIFSPPT